VTSDLRREAIEFARKHPNSHLATVQNNKPYVRVMQCVRIDDDELLSNVVYGMTIRRLGIG
jgi:uncharacterized pyridoxamine 5'-phosphate oxidase family protein